MTDGSSPGGTPPGRGWGAGIDNRHLAMLLVPVCFLYGSVSRGLIESFTVFLLPLQQDLGSDRAAIAAIYSTSSFVTGLSAPLAGRLFDRFGPRALYGLGLVLLIAGSLSASFATRAWHLQLALGLCFGFAGSALGNVPHSALLARWYRGRLSMVVAVVYASIGIGIVGVVPLAQVLIDQVGWREAYRWLGLLAVVLLPTLFLLPWQRIFGGDPVLRQPRPGTAAAPVGQDGWTLRKAAATTAFWGLFSVFFFTAIGVYAVSVQAVAYMVEIGYAPLQAASAWGFVGLLAPVGMLGFGALDSVIGRRASVGLTYALTIGSIVALWALGLSRHPAILVVFIVSLGLTYGSRGPLVSAMAARLFAGRNLGTIYGSVALGGGIGGAVGSFLGGALHDLTGGYDAVFAVAIVSAILGATPFWTIKALSRA